MILERLCNCFEEICIDYADSTLHNIPDTKDVAKLANFAYNNANQPFERAMSAYIAAENCDNIKETFRLRYLSATLLFAVAKEHDNTNVHNAVQTLPDVLAKLAESLYYLNYRNEALTMLTHAENLLPEITLRAYKKKVENHINHCKQILIE